MSNNIKKLKNGLLKHLQQVNNEIKQMESLILAAKQNKAADTIKSAIKSLTLKKKEKSLAATIISKNYRKKIAIDKKYKSFGDYMCSNLGTKTDYRVKILEELRLRGSPHVIKNLYLYFCKFGAKSLGFEKEYLIKKIVNSIFVNTGFKSTNFTTIHFKLCKFLEGTKYSKDNYMNILKRNSNLISAKKKGTNDTMEFQNTKLENCLFEECDFFGVKFFAIHVGSIIRAHEVIESDRKVEATRFYKCNFKFGTCFQYPLKHNGFGLVDSKYNMTFSIIKELEGRGVNKNLLKFKRVDYTVSPCLIFEDCKFNVFSFGLMTHAATPQVNANLLTLFLNCEFIEPIIKKGSFNFYNLIFHDVKFVKCKFNNINFGAINFSKCIFEDCILTNCKFVKCILTGPCFIIKNSILKETYFIGCTFSDSNPCLQSCLITSDCVLNNNIFMQCNLINFVFNYETAILGGGSNSQTRENNHLLNIKNCHFICNILYGTNFDYCDLEGCDFAQRTNCIEEINWLGKAFSKITNPRRLGGNIKKIETHDLEFLNDHFGSSLENMNRFNVCGITNIYTLKNRQFTNGGYSNAEEFITSKNIHPWDYFECFNNDFLYFIPPTSFNEANLKTCKFSGIDGFESFDFSKIAKDNIGRPNLNSTDFTNVDLTNANLNNANLLGSVFQVATVKGVDFRNAIVNENTDFENTIDIGLIAYPEQTNINFGELQNNANETHARAQFIINNREKYKEFYESCKNLEKLLNIFPENDTTPEKKEMYKLTKIKEMYEEIIIKIKSRGNITSDEKRIIKSTFHKFIMICINVKIIYSHDQKIKLETDFNNIITDEFINILTSQKNPLRGGLEGKWCWFELVLDSLLFLFTCPKTYIYNFFEFYFYDIFNAHGTGGRSCTLGMVERFVTIHSQVAEKFIMTIDIEPTPSIVNLLKHYNEGNPEEIDGEITRDYIIGFNDPSKLTSPNNCKLQLHKFALNKFLNLLKPNSNLPEEAEEDFGFNFDYTIKPEWREEFQDAAKEQVISSDIYSFDELCSYFVLWIKEKILLENGYSKDIVNEIKATGGKRGENFIKKLEELANFLENEELPNFRLAIIMMTSEEVTHEELVNYFEGGGKRRKKTIKKEKKAKGILQKAKSFSLSKTKSLSSKRIKSAPSKISLSLLDKLDRIIVRKFLKLPKEKIRKVFNNVCEPAVKFFPKNMSIEDKEYRNILEKKVKTMKINNLLFLQNKKVFNNYEKNMKKRFSSVSESPKKTSSAKKSITISSRRNRITRRSTRRSSRRPKRNSQLTKIRVSKKGSSK